MLEFRTSSKCNRRIAYLTAWYRGFQTTSRANPLAQQIVEANIANRLPPDASYYSSENCELP
jgi:CRISPR/Cas system-associated endonuclease Cas1